MPALRSLHGDLLGTLFAEDLDPAWYLTFDGPDDTGLTAALTHLSNGHVGLRGAQQTLGASRPGQLHCRAVYAESRSGCRELVSLPVPTVRYRREVTAGIRRILDLRRGLLHLEEVADVDGRSVRVRSTQLLHATQKSLGLRLVTATGTDAAAFAFEWDFTPGNPVRYRAGDERQERLYSCDLDAPRPGVQRLELHITGRVCTVDRAVLGLSGAAEDGMSIVDAWSLAGTPAEPMPVASLSAANVRTLIEQHCQWWADRWRTAAVRLDGDAALQQGLNFSVFNLQQHDDAIAPADTSPARGLSSTHHAGGTFFDAELHKDAYWAWTAPAVARKHLMYRHRGLPQARYLARVTGFRGARYPVAADDIGAESGLTSVCGADTGEWEPQHNVMQSLHVSADVAVAVDRYVTVTRDMEFLWDFGLEMLVEIARYSSSLLRRVTSGRLGVVAAMGPDEYHADASGVAYNNELTRHALSLAARHVAACRSHDEGRIEQVLAELDVDPSEIESWGEQAASILPISHDERTGVPVQFEGYFQLHDPAPQARGAVSPRAAARTQVIKQADLALLGVVLPDTFDLGQLERLYDYYEPRTAHGSSLSRVPYGTIAAWLRRSGQTIEHLRHLCRLNLDFDVRGEYSNGLHLSAYAGAWQVLFEGIFGARRTPTGIVLNPFLPTGIERLALTVVVGSAPVEFTLSAGRLTVSSDRPDVIDVEVGSSVHSVVRGRPLVVAQRFATQDS